MHVQTTKPITIWAASKGKCGQHIEGDDSSSLYTAFPEISSVVLCPSLGSPTCERHVSVKVGPEKATKIVREWNISPMKKG